MASNERDHTKARMRCLMLLKHEGMHLLHERGRWLARQCGWPADGRMRSNVPHNVADKVFRKTLGNAR